MIVINISAFLTPWKPLGNPSSTSVPKSSRRKKCAKSVPAATPGKGTELEGWTLGQFVDFYCWVQPLWQNGEWKFPRYGKKTWKTCSKSSTRIVFTACFTGLSWFERWHFMDFSWFNWILMDAQDKIWGCQQERIMEIASTKMHNQQECR